MKNISFTPIVLLLAFATAVLAQSGAGSNELMVRSTNGPVKVRLEERWQSPSSGMILNLPSIVSTGTGGSAKLSQNETSMSIAANTAVEFFEAVPGEAMQRIVQERGNAFYDIAPRESNKLRVETAYLVAVIKGTQFDVTADANSSTITLFEGHLRIEAPDIADVVNITAGQIASRRRGEPYITVIDMQSGAVITHSSGALANNGGRATTKVGVSVDEGVTVAGGVDIGPASVDIDGNASLGLDGVEAGFDSELVVAGQEIGLDAVASLGMDGAELNLGSELNLDAGVLEVETGLDLDASLDPIEDLIGETLLEEPLLDPDITEIGTEDIVPDVDDLIGI